MRELRRVQQPPEERLGLARAAQMHERLERERRVAHPAEAVVPVALATDLLGQRGRRGGGDRARRRVNEQLERERAADHRVAPRPVVRRAARPTRASRPSSRPSRRSTSSRRGRDQRLLVRGAHSAMQRRARPHASSKRPADRRAVDLGVAGVPRADRQRVAPPTATGTPPRHSMLAPDLPVAEGAGRRASASGRFPATPSTRRTSSRVGPSPGPAASSRPSRAPTPCAVVNVVSSTLVSGR